MGYLASEAAKHPHDVFVQKIITSFIQGAPVFELMYFNEVAGDTVRYQIQEAMSGIGFRGYNETIKEYNGVIQNETETLRVISGIASVDRAITKTRLNKAELLGNEIQNKTSSMAKLFQHYFFKGDKSLPGEERGFDGLEKRILPNRILDAKGKLTLDVLDEALLMTVPTSAKHRRVLFMSTQSLVQFRKAIRNEASIVLTPTTTDYGHEFFSYLGFDIFVLHPFRFASQGEKEGDVHSVKDFDTLGFNETYNGVEDTASIYAVIFGEGYSEVAGFMNDSGIEVQQYDLKNNKIVDIEAIMSFGIFSPTAVTRIAGITK